MFRAIITSKWVIHLTIWGPNGPGLARRTFVGPVISFLTDIKTLFAQRTTLMKPAADKRFSLMMSVSVSWMTGAESFLPMQKKTRLKFARTRPTNTVSTSGRSGICVIAMWMISLVAKRSMISFTKRTFRRRLRLQLHQSLFDELLVSFW